MLSKFLIVGVGGSGGKTLRALRNNLELKLSQAGWNEGLPKAWQLLHIDSPVKQDGSGFPAPLLPSSDYKGLSKAGQRYSDQYFSVLDFVDPNDKEDFKAFLPDEHTDVDSTIGAGQLRGAGRVIALSGHEQLRQAIRVKLDELLLGEAEPELARLARQLGLNDQIKQSPTVIVISSIAGGSGAGQFLEVTEIIKGLKPAENWVHETVNLLYAPDVFTEVDQQLLVGNALFSMGEIMSGLWSKPCDGTIRMTERMALGIPYSSPNYKTGAKYNFMVGKGLFAEQQDVYRAVATSLTTWMTDEDVNDKLTAFTQGNYKQSTLEAHLPDNSGLKEANKDATPFMALGFGRVGLGKERFVAYAAQRLARSAIDRMLYQHTLEDPKFALKTEDEWITFFAEKNLFEFIDSAKLNEETEEHNDIVDAIRPNRDAAYIELKAKVLAKASESSNEKNAQSLIDWDESLRGAFNVYIQSFLDSDRTQLNLNMRNWVKYKKIELIKLTSRFVSQQGIKVTAEILLRLASKLSGVADELRAEAQVSLKYAADLSSYIRGELGKFPEKNQDKIPAGHEVIEAALDHVAWSFFFRAEANLKQDIASIVEDMSANFISPLKDDLSGIFRGLLSQKSDFEKWATEEQSTVPRVFEPSKNEKMLIETAEYPAKFAELVNNSVVSERRANSMRVVISEVIMGGLEIQNLDRRNFWEFITQTRDWVPSLREAREDDQQSPQSAKFEVSIDPLDYLDRAQKWMRQMGTPFAGFINENLASYLVNERDKSILRERHEKFISKLEEALVDGAPLVNFNQSLMSQVHNNKASVQVVVSTIPMDSSHELYEKVKEIFKKRNLESSLTDRLFDPQTPNQSIDIFSVHQGVEPMVLDSIMRPISEFWNEHNGRSADRETLMLAKRPRYLYETIPAGDKPKQDILKGYFLARAFKNFRTDKDLSDSDLTHKGPKLSVWSGEGSKWCNFPHPLLSTHSVEAIDYPGAILYSLLLAIVACNGTQSLEPLEPYKRLQKLADFKSSASTAKRWIMKGDLGDGPTPDPARAGSRDDSPQGRRDALLAFVGDYLAKYQARFAKQSLASDHEEAKERDLTWEIREPLINALKALQKDIQNIELDELEDEE